jgi:DNA repair protein RadC
MDSGDKAFGIGIRDLPESERPRERLAELGEASLSKAELLAILLRVGVEGTSAVQLGQNLLHRFSGLRGLHAASFDELCAVNGMGPAKTAQIKAAIELGYRMQLETEDEKPRFTSPEKVVEILQHKLGEISQEELWVLALNTRNALIRQQLLYRGTVNHSMVRMAEIMEIPIRTHAAAIILVHNHPSGEHTPSPEDIRFTEALIKAGKMMDIAVLDHIIISRNGFSSLRREGKVQFESSIGKKWN